MSNDAMREALDRIKALVVGPRYPRWDRDDQVTHMRGMIADLCDSALAALAQSEAKSTAEPELFGQIIPSGAMMWFAAPDKRADDLMAISVGGKMIAKSHRELDWQMSMPSVVPAQSEAKPVAMLTFNRKLGTYGSAYDSRDTYRAYTYHHQPGNVAASRLGGACVAAIAVNAGDSIDRGLGLLKELQASGFGVFEIAPSAALAQPPQCAMGCDSTCVASSHINSPECNARAPAGADSPAAAGNAAYHFVGNAGSFNNKHVQGMTGKLWPESEVPIGAALFIHTADSPVAVTTGANAPDPVVERLEALVESWEHFGIGKTVAEVQMDYQSSVALSIDDMRAILKIAKRGAV
ncbi:hypothetical protein [Robbsia sp. KACC 23696]|uniref:hypothetical protein n=1 Tax=Robbsia sp. KACC 23696 TaxID=3149231 RepID=UPI00325B1D8B